jgi:peptide chain release factor 2
LRDLTDDLRALRQRLTDAESYLDLDGLRKRLVELEAEASKPGLWDDADAARRVTTELAQVKDDVDELEGLAARLSDAETLHQLAVEEHDESVATELEESLASLGRDVDRLELRSLFSGEYDERDAVCEVHSGAGGTDSQDWAEMLLRMYLRWAERRGFSVELDEVSAGTEAGITTATFIVRGRYAYGFREGSAPPRAHLAVRRPGPSPHCLRLL